LIFIRYQDNYLSSPFGKEIEIR
jgi:hypothetical protein